MSDNKRSAGIIKFLFYAACAVGMFWLVGFLHTQGYFDKWYYHSAGEDGYAINADNFKNATKENPALLEVGEFDKITGLQAVPVKKGGLLPRSTNGVITLTTLVESKRARFENGTLKVSAAVVGLEEEVKRIKEEKAKGEPEIKEAQKGAAKDGYAINMEAASGVATPESPVMLDIVTGDAVNGAQAIAVKKGGPMPSGADAIITDNMLKDGSQTVLEGEKIKVITKLTTLKGEGGFAVHTADISGASEAAPVILQITSNRDVQPGQAFPLKKGDIMPLNVDTVVEKDVVLAGKKAELVPTSKIMVIIPWEFKESKGFKYKDTFMHKGIKTMPIAALYCLLIIVGLGVSLGYMAEGFTDMIGIKLEKIHHH